MKVRLLPMTAQITFAPPNPNSQNRVPQRHRFPGAF